MAALERKMKIFIEASDLKNGDEREICAVVSRS